MLCNPQQSQSLSPSYEVAANKLIQDQAVNKQFV
jgi:hypothetical protein